MPKLFSEWLQIMDCISQLGLRAHCTLPILRLLHARLVPGYKLDKPVPVKRMLYVCTYIRDNVPVDSTQEHAALFIGFVGPIKIVVVHFKRLLLCCSLNQL